eukprot:Plantae.Rhodophyta-Purpureofilum_apyrenoidigerum.ctg7126.p2 GENE.Plantae.Rhodophyta-Purpureofilum_apyrenoidigerum.ctg7126~~Plantae.Rhodophyta-Purpureofilum_apyrenoidigerum.ctg7126.p2  ORF type:complete len:386 (-),score=70.18 Plantae.Rhodophyta-Purpureofilum_apyrenoidigerum.ctg7126:1917-3074(-)
MGTRGHMVVLMLTFLLLCDIVRVSVAKKEKNYYQLLDIAPDADQATIKKRFRKMSVQFHPDKNPGNKEAADMFTKIATAYEVLSDPEKRRIYDMYGEEGLQNGGGNGHHDPFDDFFGSGFGGGGGRRRGRPEKRVGPSIRIPVFASLEQLYSGDVVEASHKKQVICAQWGDCEKICDRCGGQGVIMVTRQLAPGFITQAPSHCPKCGGKGKIVSGECNGCPSGQFEQAEKMLLIDIEKGVPEGNLISFPEEADEMADHYPGNVEFEIRTAPHDRFERRGDDLYHLMNISLVEALVGVRREVKQLDGRQVHINKSSITSPHEVVYLNGEGMPVFEGEGHGKMIVEFWVEFPKEISQDQKELVEKLFGNAASAASRVANMGVEHSDL